MPAERRISQISSAASGSSSTTRIRAGKVSLPWRMRFQRRSAVVSNLRNYLRRFRVLQPAIQFLSKQWEYDWFREVRSATRLQNPLLLRHQGVRRYGNHRNCPRFRFLAHPREEVEPVVFAEIDIE